MFTLSLLIPGARVTPVGAYRFRCPVCARTFDQDDRYEPLCTGPTWRDDHEPTVMIFTEARKPQAYTL